MITANEILKIMEENEIDIDIDKLDYDVALNDQGVDSLDITSILFAVEEKYQIRIPDEDIENEKLSSINAIVEYVNNLEELKTSREA